MIDVEHKKLVEQMRFMDMAMAATNRLFLAAESPECLGSPLFWKDPGSLFVERTLGLGVRVF